MGTLRLVAVSALAVGTAWVLVRGIRSVAPRFNLVDVPNPRSLHSAPTPRGGGLAIALVCLAVAAIAVVWTGPLDWRPIGAYLLGGMLIVAVGIIDDLRGLSPLPKLAVQVGASACLALGLAQHLLSLDPRSTAWIVLFTAAAVTIALTNAYNFMDGSDGLAATQGVLAGIGWTVIAISSGRFDLAVLALAVAGSCLGFLAHNFPPASIFMGDVGSSFLGFTFAFLPLALAHDAGQLFAGLVMIWPFVFDAFLTIGRRLARRQNIFRAHREHLYQRLVLAGWSARSVLLVYGLFSLACAVLATVWWNASSALRGLVILTLLLASAALWRVVTRVEVLAV